MSSLAPVKSRLVLPFWYRLTQVVLEKRPLNGCSCSFIISGTLSFRVGSMQKTFGEELKIDVYFQRYDRGQTHTDRRTDRHAHRDTPLPYRGRSNNDNYRYYTVGPTLSRCVGSSLTLVRQIPSPLLPFPFLSLYPSFPLEVGSLNTTRGF